MANPGNAFRNCIKDYIDRWGAPLEVLQEVNVGFRFVGRPRKMDIVIRNKENNRYLAIECKVQLTGGTAYEKLFYTLEDRASVPIPTIIVFAGPAIQNDIKSRLVMSGRGIEVDFEMQGEKVTRFQDPNCLLKQRCYIELGLNWFEFATGDKIKEQLKGLGYKRSGT